MLHDYNSYYNYNNSILLEDSGFAFSTSYTVASAYCQLLFLLAF